MEGQPEDHNYHFVMEKLKIPLENLPFRKRFLISNEAIYYTKKTPSRIEETIKAGVIRHTSQPSHSLAYIIKIQKTV